MLGQQIGNVGTCGRRFGKCREEDGSSLRRAGLISALVLMCVGIAAGAAPGYAGAAPKANLLSVDVMNDNGQSTVGDVIKYIEERAKAQ